MIKSQKKKTKAAKFTTAKKVKPKTSASAKPVKSHLVPVTVELLNETRKELIHRFDSGLNELGSRLDRRIDRNQAAISDLGSIVRQGFNDLKSEINGIKSEMNGMRYELKAEMSGMRSEFKAELHAQRAIYEEQKARNDYVLDGYALLHDRQDRGR